MKSSVSRAAKSNDSLNQLFAPQRPPRPLRSPFRIFVLGIWIRSRLQTLTSTVQLQVNEHVTREAALPEEEMRPKLFLLAALKTAAASKSTSTVAAAQQTNKFRFSAGFDSALAAKFSSSFLVLEVLHHRLE